VTEKITIIKVLGKDDAGPTVDDIKRWREIFALNQMTPQQAEETGEVQVETLSEKQEGQCYMTLVKIGGEDFRPTFDDLESWKQVFEEAKNDPDFKIFTHPAVDIRVINIGKIVAVE
jgi:hypothetical protein